MMMMVYVYILLLLPVPLFSLYNCTLEPEVGPCRGSFQRFFYNINTAQCEVFNYGGCQGNANNFEEVEACQAF
ncbi:unnamed protein product, partial [Candidula unifasciata]